MKHILIATFLGFVFLLSRPVTTYAIENPTTVPNNKFGIHILFPTELDVATRLINTSGGDWGYVTIPVQSGDQNLVKWQLFMDNAREKHIIPIIRLATEGDYFNTKVWRRPTASDVLDFANFLSSLQWPTKNKYIIVFNEVNRGDEWGGAVDPASYADLLTYAVTVFKNLDPDFFIISAGLDNASPNAGSMYMNEYDYMRAMEYAKPGTFAQIDGISSHAYPNPAFSQPPSVLTSKSIASFSYEKKLAESFAKKPLPVFITETGWSNKSISSEDIASYYVTAFQSVWNDPGIVAVTPFLLHGGGQFGEFSFMTESGAFTKQYEIFQQLGKTKGSPTLNKKVLSSNTMIYSLPEKDFRQQKDLLLAYQVSDVMKNSLKWLFKL